MNPQKRDLAQARGIAYMNAPFDSESMEELLHRLEEMSMDGNVEEIEIRINSNGGCVYACFTLIDWINKSKKKVKTVVLGKAFSAGALLLAAGHERIANENSFILLHDVANDAGYEKRYHHKDNLARLEVINKKMTAFLKSRTKLTDKDLELYMDSGRDVFIDAKTALKLGIVDKIAK